ncbi:HAD family hydrolase [Pedobacter sp. MW01-1-1]|uniref:HAD family hydrolase n=1 Tax=Pedobacter sp. MW01-1-1 TaxID=3383027 RepID=UPI003FF14C63
MENYAFAKDKKVVVFELDDVLYPKKDYLLQLYYLFAQFIEYTDQKEAKPILDFMQSEYIAHGETDLFGKTVKQFDLSPAFKYNFDLLHKTARLPLKLLLFQNILNFLQELVVNRIKICIVTDGDPEEQLNKIKQTEWNGLGEYLTVYFTQELNKTKSAIYEEIIKAENITTNELLVVGNNKNNERETEFHYLSYIVSVDIL